MTNRIDDRRMRKVAPMVWEVLGTFEKTRNGLWDVERQRRYVALYKPIRWPEFADDRLTARWKGRSCEFSPRQRNQHVLLKMLAESRGRHVEYATIGECCMGDEMKSANAIRQFKRRLVKTLIAKGMGDLAAAIKVDGENMWLKL